MTFSALVVAFEDEAYDRLLRRSRERGLSLAEGRALEWLLDGGEVATPQRAKVAGPSTPHVDEVTGATGRS